MSIEPSVRLGKRSPLALTMKRPKATLRKWLVAFLWCMTVILWVRSLWVGDRLMIRTKSTYMGIVSGDGRLCLFECARSDPAFSNFGTGCVDFGAFDADLWGRFNGDRNSYFTWENTGLIRYNAAMPELKRPGNLRGIVKPLLSDLCPPRARPAGARHPLSFHEPRITGASRRGSWTPHDPRGFAS
jgi:hypothetical protein